MSDLGLKYVRAGLRTAVGLRGATPLLCGETSIVCVTGTLWGLSDSPWLGREDQGGGGGAEWSQDGGVCDLGSCCRLEEGIAKWPVPVWDFGKYILFF